MWINDKTTPELPVMELFNSNQGVCVLAANAKLEVIQNFLRMAEFVVEDSFFEEEFPDEECVSLSKKAKSTPQAGKKRKPQA
jgi:hypothetical protein